MQFTTVRSKEKDYDIYLKSEKLHYSQYEHKKMFPKCGKNWFLAISSLTHTVAAIQRKKKVDPCSLENKKFSTTIRRKEKYYDIYLKSEKTASGARKNFPATWKWKKLVPSYFEHDKHCCSFSREKKLEPCYLETKKCSSQLLGARKKIMTSIVTKTGSQPVGARKKCFPAIWRWEKLVPSYFEPD